jgi:hypothetical protein
MEISKEMNDMETNNAIKRYLKLFKKRGIDTIKLSFIEKKIRVDFTSRF